MHILADPRVQRAEGFIEQQHARLHHERLGNRQPLLHPAGELRRVFIQRVPQPDFLQHPPRPFAGVAFPAGKQPAKQR